MKKLLLPFAFSVLSTPVFADTECYTAHREVMAVLVFDNGPGGLDAVEMSVFGKQYSDDLYEVEQNPSVTKISDRDTFLGTYEYTHGHLAVGFKGSDGLQVDIFADELRKDRFVGTLHLIEPGKERRILPVTCDGSL